MLDHLCLLHQRKLCKTHLSASDSSYKNHSSAHWPQCASAVNCTSISSQSPNLANFSIFMSRKNHYIVSFNLSCNTSQGISSCYFISFHCRFVTPSPALKQFFVSLPYALTNFSISFWNSVTELTPITNNHHNTVHTRGLNTLFHIYSRIVLILLLWHHSKNARSGCINWSCMTSGHSGPFHWDGLYTFTMS